jgi:hypothetical protein
LGGFYYPWELLTLYTVYTVADNAPTDAAAIHGSTIGVMNGVASGAATGVTSGAASGVTGSVANAPGWVILGELDKYVALSAQRWTRREGPSFCVKGSAQKERVILSAVDPELTVRTMEVREHV